MNIKREKRLNSEFQREIYSILKYKVKNPELMRIRTVPELRFLVDTSEEYGNKIDAILSGITYNTENDDEN